LSTEGWDFFAVVARRLRFLLAACEGLVDLVRFVCLSLAGNAAGSVILKLLAGLLMKAVPR